MEDNYGVEAPPPRFQIPSPHFEEDFADTYAEGYVETQKPQGSLRRYWKILVGVGCLVFCVVLGAAAMLATGGGGGGGSAVKVESNTAPGSVATGGGSSSVDPDLPESILNVPTFAPTPDPLLTGEIYEIVKSHAYFGGNEFRTKTSYQYKAFLWVLGTSEVGTHTPERIVQRYALACLYYATNGVRTLVTDRAYGTAPVRNWIDEQGWLDWDEECSWYKIECNGNGFVNKIELFANRLTGSLPPELTLLKKSLEIIDLFNNPIFNSGPDGNDWLGELTGLKKLFYGSTNFQYDGIPPAIGKLTNLVEYDCSFSLYFGALDGSVFQDLNNLEYLYIGGNSYNSSVPTELATLPKLQYFYAEYTDLIDSLDFVVRMPSIIEIWIDRNPKITGTIPSELGLVTTLESLSVTGCGLTGSIPPQIGNLKSLKQTWLYGNGLTGRVPTEMGNLWKLETLGIEDTELTGSVPSEICMNRVPNGLLGALDADCDGEITCDCCTCCGAQCATVNPSGGRRNYARRNLLY